MLEMREELGQSPGVSVVYGKVQGTYSGTLEVRNGSEEGAVNRSFLIQQQHAGSEMRCGDRVFEMLRGKILCDQSATATCFCAIDLRCFSDIFIHAGIPHPPSLEALIPKERDR